jgi:hypothetical protein
MSDEIPLNAKDVGYFIALQKSIEKAQRNIEPGTDFQKGAISAFNDVLDMIERILKIEQM